MNNLQRYLSQISRPLRPAIHVGMRICYVNQSDVTLQLQEKTGLRQAMQLILNLNVC